MDQPKSMKDLLADWLTGKFGVDYQIGLWHSVPRAFLHTEMEDHNEKAGEGQGRRTDEDSAAVRQGVQVVG
jgi:hypothetical protein